jgi:Vault protein inter-alpha-trypsin domain/Carboxypeptidase regulatory-like domain
MVRSRVLLFTVFCFVSAALLAADRPAIPTLTVDHDDGHVALELSELAIRVTIRSHLARTEFEMTYRNSLPRIAGGDFRFPLPADAEVSDLGLYFDGHLRRGVAVERVLAKRAYEEVVHRRVDPALVEWSNTRNFRLRVYPIPANGEKKVYLAYDQELTTDDYVLDLRYGKAMKFRLDVDAEDRAVDIDGTVQTSKPLDAIVRVARDARETALVARSNEDNAWYATAAIDVAPPEIEVPPAAQVVILYDASSSSVQQDGARIRRFLASFLAQQQAWAKADVVPFHIALDRGRRIENAGTAGGHRELERVLAEQQFLGATNLLAVFKELPAIAASLPVASRIVLVTDGVSSLGDSRDVAAAVAKLAEMRRPLLVVHASNAADDQLVANAARVTGGWSFDLRRIDPERAASAAMRAPSQTRTGGNVVPRAILGSGATRTLVALRANGAIATLPVAGRDVPVRALHGETEASMVRRAWARAKLRELMNDGAPDEQLIDHGRTFTQLTPRTSLLVLESWRDYEQYDIPMPPDVVAARQRDLDAREAAMRESRSTRLTIPPALVTPGAWFVKGRALDASGTPLPGVTVLLRDNGTPISGDITDGDGRFLLPAPTAPANPTVVAHLEGFQTAQRGVTEGAPSGAIIDITLNLASVSETITVTAEAPMVEMSGMSAGTVASALRTNVITKDALLQTIATESAVDSDDPEVRAAIALQRRELTREVVAKLRTFASTSDRVRYYLSARALLGGDKSFHVFAAEAFRERSPEIAARVLSDLAEAHANDAPLLRILARALDGWGEADVARLLLRRAIELSPGEPQSWREMILLEARHGRPSEVASWSKRLQATRGVPNADVDEIYGQIDESATRWTRASAFDRQRGVDVRIDAADDLTVELMWDTGYSYVDIHITEPGGEIVKWDHTESKAGGTFTGGNIFGFGPEIYRIANAPRGEYRVNMHYYAANDTNVSLETLAHVVIYQRGRRGAIERTEHFVVLSIGNEERVLTAARLE